MKTLKDLTPLKAVTRPIVLAAGFFDGFHRGHCRIIARAVARAGRLGGQAWLLTFDRHPLEVLRPDLAPRLLTDNEHKVLLMKRLGLDGCVMLPFSRAFSALEAEDFIRLLRDRIPTIKEVLVGENWRFGRGQSGDPALLARLGRRLGFAVRVVPAVRHGGRIVSSTWVRKSVMAGRLREAADLLGRPYSVLGKVVHGRAVGTRLGFPTANLRCASEALPPFGVYAARARVGSRLLDGLLYFGLRPTFRRPAEEAGSLELHLLDFRGNLYGKTVEVFPLVRLRGERRFPSEAALQAQIAADIRRTRSLRSPKKAKETLYRFSSGAL